MQKMGDISLSDVDVIDEIEGYHMHQEPKAL